MKQQRVLSILMRAWRDFQEEDEAVTIRPEYLALISTTTSHHAMFSELTAIID
jgi:hypothetical protein